MRKVFGAMAIAAALLVAGGAHAQRMTEDPGTKTNTEVEPGSDAASPKSDQGQEPGAVNPQEGEEQRTANPDSNSGSGTGMQPTPQNDNDGSGTCECPCPKDDGAQPE
jgi:hypothetical protein